MEQITLHTQFAPLLFLSCSARVFEAAHEVGASVIPHKTCLGAVSFAKRDRWRLVVGGVVLGHLTRSALHAMLLWKESLSHRSRPKI